MNEEIQLVNSVLAGKTALSLKSRSTLLFTGSDRARYLNGQTTNDVTKLEPGHTLHAAVCTAKGKMQGELFIANTGQQLLVDFPQSLEETLPARLEKYLIADDAEIQLPEPVMQGIHFLVGAASELPDLPTDAQIFQSRRFGRDGHDIWFPTGQEIRVPVASDTTAEWIRIQTGTPLWGIDATENHLPPEIYPETSTISYKKGCYIGQETIARIKSIGRVNKMLCLLRGKAPVAAVPQDLNAGNPEKTVGTITSCQQSPDDNGNIHALAMIQSAHSKTGTILSANRADWQVVRPCC
jgi:folate-binding protein YgfZ